MIGYQPASTGGGGGTGGPETDPVAVPMVVTHRASTDHDAHNDGRYTPTAHQTAADPHGDRSHSDTGDSSHLAAVDPHSSNVHSDGQLSAHVSAVDPHGDRASAAAHADGADQAHVAAADPHGSIAALNAHKTAAGAHSAPNISLDPTGLLVVNGADVKTAIAQLDAATNNRVAKPASPNDGDAIIWSAAQGGYVSAKPGQELAYAEIQANYAMTGAAANVPGLSMVVPASTVPVELEIMLPVYNIQCNASGDTSVGQVAVMLWDGTNRWLYAIRFHAFSGPSQTIVDGLAIKRRLPNVAAPLTLNLQAWFIGATVTAAQIFAGNGQAANYSPAYIKAKVA